MTQNIAIIGANYFQLPLILKAKEKGYTTHVFAWEDGAVGKAYADKFYPISIVEKEEILRICKELNIVGICTIASDLANITVNYVAEHLNLPCNGEQVTFLSTNKYAMRKTFLKAGVAVPKFLIADENLDLNKVADFSMPLITKPTDRSGSRGINKVENIEDLLPAIKDSLKDAFEKKAIVEEFIEGNEYSCECVSYQGEHHFLTITKKYTTGAPHFIETGHIEPSDLTNEQVDNVKKVIFKALDALGVKNGASHSEFKVTSNNEIKIIEIGSRMGGDCIGSDLVRLSTGYDFVGMVVDIAVGKAPNFKKVCEEKVAVIKFIFNQHDYEVIMEQIKKDKSTLFYLSEIEEIGSRQVTDSGTRFGYAIFTFNKKDDAKIILDSMS